MSEKPFLCTSQVVRNFLDGKQTQDRRPMKKQPPVSAKSAFEAKDGSGEWKFFSEPLPQVRHAVTDWIKPPCSVGDLLYVRETWCPGDAIFHKGTGIPAVVRYKADGPPIPGMWDDLKWRPSIHMPKAYARLWLEVTGVRAERIQDISEEDVKAEGQPESSANSPRVWFMALWESLYPGSWNRNEWVWVYDLRRIER